MACSGAAMETALLVGLDSWATRFWLLALGLAQGDWVRVDPTRLIKVSDNPNSKKQRLMDCMPSLMLFVLIYVLAGAILLATETGHRRVADAFALTQLVIITVV